MLQIAMPDRSGSNHKRAVGNRIGNRFILFGAGQHVCRAHCGASALKCYIVGMHHSQMAKSEVAHCPSGGADVERIARIHQDHTQVIEFNSREQGILYSTAPLAEGSASTQLRGAEPNTCTPLAAWPIPRKKQM